MNKYLILGLLLIGAAFARPPDMSSRPEWGAYAQACCSFWAASTQLNFEYNNFLFGESCGPDSELLDAYIFLNEVMWGDGEVDGLRDYYLDYAYACGGGGEGTDECVSAKSTLRSRISTAKGIFLNGKIFAYLAARQAVIDGNPNTYDCGTDRTDFMNLMQYVRDYYRMCNNDKEGYCLSPPA